MRIFAIRDDNIYEYGQKKDTSFHTEHAGAEQRPKDLAYLFYYEKDKLFYTELPEDAEPWETPLLLSSFAERGIKTVDSYWSLRWVQQRIVPSDRQNIGMVLKENGLTEYDEFKLLMLARGRCAQDDCYLEEIRQADLPEAICRRFQKRVENVLPLGNLQLLVFFCDGNIKKCDLTDYFQEHAKFRILTQRADCFEGVRVQTGGYGVIWDVNLNISDTELDQMGTEIPLTASDFKNYADRNIINAAEACEILGCSRQNINELVKHGKLHPLKIWERNTLFLRSEVVKRLWQ